MKGAPQGSFMLRLRSITLPLLPLLLTLSVAHGQVSDSGETQSPSVAGPIPSNAQRMCKQTRYEIIRDFETQLVYARTAFPMGTKGLLLNKAWLRPMARS